MISNNSELYDTVRSLIRQLTAAGEVKWSFALSDALSISSVPGEVLGEIDCSYNGCRPVLLRRSWVWSNKLMKEYVT